FFFFQAEDGIRDFHVTGVQTCALPISRFLERIGHPAADHARRCGPVLSGWPGAAPIPSVQTPSSSLPCEYETGRNRKTTRDPSRSEERRVGKEWRSRWWS